MSCAADGRGANEDAEVDPRSLISQALEAVPRLDSARLLLC